MRAALDVLGAAQPGEGGRRIAVLGDMLELGDQARNLHADLAEPLEAAGVELAFLAGEEMKALDDVLEARVRREWHENPGELLDSLLKTMRTGDVIMVKASKSIGFSPLVDKLLALYPPRPVTTEAPEATSGDAMSPAEPPADDTDPAGAAS
jgi:UDP-N-acetylmuramoyl-tripeptide--D-alanyl-D-alanine ligase